MSGPLPWFWRMTGGPGDGKTVQSTQVTGEPPAALVCFPAPVLAEQFGGFMPVPDDPDVRATLLETFEPRELHSYERESMSRIDDEGYIDEDGMGAMPNVMRGAQYRYAGTLDVIDLDAERRHHHGGEGDHG